VLDLVLFCAAGLGAGVFTGLVPGLHNNTLATVALGFFLGGAGQSSLPLSLFVLCMAVSNSFLEFVPAIFLGAPDADDVLAVAPGHKLLMAGKGHEALWLAVFGGMIGVAALLLTLPIWLAAIPPFYSLVRPNIHFVLIGLMAVMIAVERKKFWALLVFGMAGAFGFFSSRLPVDENYVLLPMLTGLFGLSSLALSFGTKTVIPKQQKKFERQNVVLPSALGFLGGVLAGLLPGFGSAQSAVLVQELSRMRDARSFLSAQGAINATNTLFSIVALYLIGNPRSGSAVVIEKMLGNLQLWHVGLFVLVGGGVALVSALIAIRAGALTLGLVTKADYRLLNLSVITLLGSITFAFTGFFGLAIAGAGATIGIIPHLVGVKKSLCMGCLIVPTILWFFGVR